MATCNWLSDKLTHCGKKKKALLLIPRTLCRLLFLIMFNFNSSLSLSKQKMENVKEAAANNNLYASAPIFWSLF